MAVDAKLPLQTSIGLKKPQPRLKPALIECSYAALKVFSLTTSFTRRSHLFVPRPLDAPASTPISYGVFIPVNARSCYAGGRGTSVA